MINVGEDKKHFYLCIHYFFKNGKEIVISTTMNQDIFLSIPKSDITFFKELTRKTRQNIDIRENILKEYMESRPKKVNLSEEEIVVELNSIRYGE